MADREQLNSKGNGKVLAGVNLVIYTVVGIAILVLANWFVSRHDQRWDLTPNQKFSLSPETVKILKGLDHDISIYVFDTDRNMRTRRDLMDNYSAVTSRIAVRYVDPVRQPSLARQFSVSSDGVIVVVAGDRHFEAKSPDEEGVTNALVHVLKEQKTIYFVQGHGEKDVDSSDRHGYSVIKKQLENENYRVKTVNLLEKTGIPADCSILIIAGPQKDFLQQEVDSISAYMKSGGRLIVMFDALGNPRAEFPANLAKLMSSWNVTVQDDLAIDPDIQIANAGPGLTIVQKYGASPIVQPLSGIATLFPLSQSFGIGKDSKPGVTPVSLCETSPDGYGLADFNSKVSNFDFRAGKDIKGPLTLAVSGSITGEGGSSKEARFVAFGSSELVSNGFMIPQFANLDLFMNSVSWLGSEEDMISVRPKPPESQHLDITASQMNKILFLGVLGVPLFIIAVGASVWWRRR